MKKLFLYFILAAIFAFVLNYGYQKSLYMEDCTLPVIRVYTQDGAEVLSRDEYVRCYVDVVNCNSRYLIGHRPAEIKVRGNASAFGGDVDMIRKNEVPYRIKFNQRTNMLGLNDDAMCRSWVLLNHYQGYIGDELALRLGRTILDESQYCSDSTYVYLYINDEFCGIRLLCEQSQVHENRIDIYDPAEGEKGVDIGYLLEIDNYAEREPDNVYFRMNYADGGITDIHGVYRDFRAANYSIKSKTTDPEQKSYMEYYLNNVFRALYDACVNGVYSVVNRDGDLVKTDYASSHQVADELLDLESVVNMYILYELMQDCDVGAGSFYMIYDFSPQSASRKLQFTCPWDFSFTTPGTTDGIYNGAYWPQEYVDAYGDRSNPWFVMLMTEDWFVDMVRQRWTQLRRDGSLQACIDEDRMYFETHAESLNSVCEVFYTRAAGMLEWMEKRFEGLDSHWLLEE